MKTLELSMPLEVNGKKYEKLNYNALDITADQFLEATQKATERDKSKTVQLKQKENDYALHFYLGAAAIIACNPEFSFEDLERVKGYDTLKITDVGWLFILRTSGEISEESSSDAQLENTVEHSTQESKTSEAQD